jgi:hypothetical protein
VTIEKVREILKVHIKAADSVGKMETAMALMEVLDAIDSEIAIENRHSERK